MPAQAGPIAVNAGAVAHTATMSGVFLLDGNGPQGYTTIGVGSDNFIKQGTAYAVQASAGTTNPTWTWFWPSPDTWLVTTFALNRAPAPGANQAPTANFTSSCSALNCSFTSTSNDPDGTIASYSWTFGDGGTSIAQNPSHNYTAAGSYPVTLQVTDNQGAQSPITTKSVNVTAANQAPTANFTSSCNALNCSFTSTSSDPDGTIASYSWNFGDGGTSIAQNPSHNYTAAGSYPVTLQVTDDQGAPSPITTKTVNVTAPNSAPVVNAGADEPVLLGLLYSTSFSFSDPDNGPWNYTIDWGDGATSTGSRPSAGSFSASHTYSGLILLGKRTIRVTVTDSLGASGSDTKNVTIVLSL